MAVFPIKRKNINACQQCGTETDKFYIWAQNRREAHIKANKIIMKQGKLLCWECFKKWLWKKQEKYQRKQEINFSSSVTKM
ncbi:hypothetical protein [Thermodesulfovibrio sp. 1176]|uniref:hypothetical protein n=1 Tax=Thermodesulfovibrio sp. 1176 TaxID=3043424 RepID=UPI002482C2B2|nr:hypothetical protein [Thermodesulfovibrio sp. 1176]